MSAKRAHCTYCKRHFNNDGGGLTKTRDHIVPKCDGGNRIVPACLTCNQMKGNMSREEWWTFTHEFPQWWLAWRLVGRYGKGLFYSRDMQMPEKLRGPMWQKRTNNN